MLVTCLKIGKILPTISQRSSSFQTSFGPSGCRHVFSGRLLEPSPDLRRDFCELVIERPFRNDKRSLLQRGNALGCRRASDCIFSFGQLQVVLSVSDGDDKRAVRLFRKPSSSTLPSGSVIFEECNLLLDLTGQTQATLSDRIKIGAGLNCKQLHIGE
jgi:hypothetical protein